MGDLLIMSKKELQRKDAKNKKVTGAI